MAASVTQILNTKITNQLNHNHNHNHINFSDNFRPHTHSFGQVSLPIKNDDNNNNITVLSSSTRRSSVLSAAFFATSPSAPPKPPKLSEIWREIHGCDDWEDLMEPLNPLLRREIIRYGEFVAAAYKAFDLDPSSKRYLTCKYGKRNMLREVGLPGTSGYDVTKYIYATPDVDAVPDQAGGSGKTARWIGYVAVANDETAASLGRRDVVITFRGTVTNPEWIANLMSSLTPARLDPHDPRPDVKVESGFLSLYTSGESSSRFGVESCREQLLSEVSRLLGKYRDEAVSLTLAGHSMGSALANLLAYDLAELGLNRRTNRPEAEEVVPVTVFSFGGPRVGNLGFKKRCEEAGVKVMRVVNVNDPITKMPGVFFNENFRVSLGGGKYEFSPWSCSCYAHVGVELVLDFFNVQNPSCVHDLDTYIDLLKCPKRPSSSSSSSSWHHDGGDDRRNMIRWDRCDVVNNIIEGAKDFIISAQESFNMLPWVSAAGNMVNLVQSQRT